jgi:site-specific recombinase XerD
MGELRKRMLEEMKLRNLSDKTVKSYTLQMGLYARKFGKSPAELGEVDIRNYMRYLREEKELSSSSINVAYCALKFFYTQILNRKFCIEKISRPKREKKLPIILSKREIISILEESRNLKYKTILMTICSTGCRVMEAAHLKVSDIDSNRMQVRINQGKGKKDRYTILSEKLLRTLREYWKCYRPKEWLFTGNGNKGPLGESVVQKEFKEAKKKLAY